MKKSYFVKFITVLLVLTILGGLGYYFYSGLKNPPPETSVQKDPETAAYEFYKWYIEFKGHAIKSGGYKNVSFLTPEYKEEIESIDLSKRETDPILCAQDKPYKYKVAELVTEEGNAKVTMEQDYYGVIVKSNVYLISHNGNWYVDGVECLESGFDNSETNPNQIIVYFLNETRRPKQFEECGLVYGVARNPDNLENRYEKTMQYLFSGPNVPEKAQGYSSSFIFSDFLGVKVSGDIAYVNISSELKDRISNSSCQVQNLTSQIEDTLKHGKMINKIVYAFDGDPSAFYEWSQLGCTTDEGGFNYCADIDW